MFRIDSPGAAPGGFFTEGDPQNATPATVVSADWANAVQEEILAAVEAAGIAPDKNDSAQLLAAIRSIGSGGGSNPSGVGQNMVINGDFRVFQKATSSPGGVHTKAVGVAGTLVCFDRWLSSSDGGGGAGSASMTRQAFTVGQVAVPGFPKYFARHTQTIASTVAAPYILTGIEGVDGIGGTVTFSVWIKAASSANVTLRITQNFGTGGSADVIVDSAVYPISTSWQRIVLTTDLDDVSGKTVNVKNHLRLEVLFPSAATFTIDLADVQLEQAPSATGFQRRSLSTELELCRRYFEKSWAADTAATTCPSTFDGVSSAICHDGGEGGLEMTRRFMTEKRGTPTVVWFNPSNQTANQVKSGAGNHAVVGTIDASTSSTGYPDITSPGVTKEETAHWTADAELLT